MANVINTNIKSLMARDSMTINQRSMTTTMQRLSTGKRINSAADDAAGLGISTRMDSQIRGLNMAIKNANDTISVVQTAEGAMQEVDGILQRMRELSVQAASDTNGAEDRSYLQQEISQLSQEIDRISGTTQFNSMNVLDGTYKNKLFQIGSNQGQTIGFSIGSMKSSVLGVAAGQSTSATSGTDATSDVVAGLTAKGTKATATVAEITFDTNDEYAFKVKDGSTGLEADFEYQDDAGVAATLDLSSGISKQKFVDQLNKTIAQTAGVTILESGATVTPEDFTDALKVNSLKFQISIDGGMPMKTVDLRGRLNNNLGGDLTAVTVLQLRTALEEELQNLYDDSVTITNAAGVFSIEDAKGRKLVVSQGGGDGFIFGTDAANDGALLTQANPKNNITAAWSGNNLVLTNSAGGEIDVNTFAAGLPDTKVVFNVVSKTSSQDYNPIALIGADTSDDLVSFSGKTEESGFAISFANRHGGDGTAAVSFKLQTGSGVELADITLAIGDGDTAVTNQTIIDAVKTAISGGLSANDTSIRASDFNVAFNGNTLTITNSQGLSMKVAEYSSSDTQATVTPTNELGASKVLSDQGYGWSETRIKINPNALRNNLLAGTTADFVVQVDGQDSTGGDNTEAFNDVFTDWDGDQTGAELAQNLEDFLAGITDFATLNNTDAEISLADVKVEWDESTGELVVRDIGGHSITIDASALAASGEIFVAERVTGSSNNGFAINTSSSIASGQVYEATELKITLSDTKDAALDFTVNGVALGAIDWDTSDVTKVDDLKTALDSMMVTLNGVHPGTQYEYSLNGNEITILNRAGSRIEIENFESDNDGLTATLSPKAGQGEEKVIGYNEILDTAKATGVGAVATNSVLKLTGDDLISLTISDGTKTYSLDSAAVDVNNLTSTQSLVTKLNNALGGSTIKASMDTDGNLFFADSTGGDIILSGYSSARGFSAKWTPESGQGDAVTLSSGYSGGGSVSNAPSYGGNAGVITGSVSQISIATQAGAAAALKVIDKALSYVNHERSNLGAIENRLTHTIDNLTNVVTNTSASKSRIMDTDYAQETTELARSQIIQQAATAMLAQANQQPQSVLALLK